MALTDEQKIMKQYITDEINAIHPEYYEPQIGRARGMISFAHVFLLLPEAITAELANLYLSTVKARYDNQPNQQPGDIKTADG